MPKYKREPTQSKVGIRVSGMSYAEVDSGIMALEAMGLKDLTWTEPKPYQNERGTIFLSFANLNLRAPAPVPPPAAPRRASREVYQSHYQAQAPADYPPPQAPPPAQYNAPAQYNDDVSF